MQSGHVKIAAVEADALGPAGNTRSYRGLKRRRLLVAGVEQSELEEIAMANQTTDIDEGSKGGSTSVLIVGIVAACVLAFLLFFGYRGGSETVAPATPQPSTEAPATTEAPAATEAPAKPEAPAQ